MHAAADAAGPAKSDRELVRHGGCRVRTAGPPVGRREVRVGGRRTAVDRVEQVRNLAGHPRHAAAE